MDNHNRTRADQDDSGRLVEALLVLLRAIASYADVPQPAGEDWTAYSAVCRSRLLSIRYLARVAAEPMTVPVLLAEAKALLSAAAVLPYRPDLDAAPKDQRAALLAKFAPPQPTSAAAADVDEATETENQ